MLDTLLQGVLPPPEAPPVLPRPELRRRIRELLQPPVRAVPAGAGRLRGRRLKGHTKLPAPQRCPTTRPPCSQEPRHFYQIVTGPPGGGKSTLVKGAVREIGGGVG